MPFAAVLALGVLLAGCAARPLVVEPIAEVMAPSYPSSERWPDVGFFERFKFGGCPPGCTDLFDWSHDPPRRWGH